MQAIGQVPGEVSVLVHHALRQLQEPVGGARGPPVLQVTVLVIVPS